MKQRDAEKLIKGTEAFLGSLRALTEKLKTRERAMLEALETLVSNVNETIQKDFDNWETLSNELDPHGEVAPSMDAPAIDLEELTSPVEDAFEVARSGIEAGIEEFEALLERAQDEYNDPEEEDEEEEEADAYVCSCDHPGCKAESPERGTAREANEAARQQGWIVEEGVGGSAYCPKHRDQA